MHIFVTGGTGLIGSAVVPELVSHGVRVLGLARSDRSAEKLTQAGADVVRGELTDLDILRQAAKETDGVVHLAFSNDFSSGESIAQGVAEETAALKSMANAMLASNKPLVTTAGTPAFPGRPSTEDDPLPAEGPVSGRGQTVNKLIALSDQGLRSISIRLPRTVHNEGHGGFAGILVQAARDSGIAGYPGDGKQRWPAVHAKDAAALFRIALENAPGGTAWHAVGDEGDRVVDIVTVIGEQLGLSVKSVPPENFGPLGMIFSQDQPASSEKTRAALGWEPQHPSLLEDLRNL
ncbi:MULTISPECIES: SDR family oxidoreductase [Micrococcaceae]|uniref:SDR family oxidoreductase n=1 Tax=unclassified Kocuria TaxID=2649579 RepID=UPI0010124E71|nr:MULTISPECIES: SDR family oxidoreductase [unclassified Kocuria]